MKSHSTDYPGKLQVLLLFGGESSEHEVSIASATNVYAAIDTERFDCTLGYIDKHGRWWLADEVSGIASPNAEELLPLLGRRSIAIGSTERILTPDVVLPILHGKNGEDGSVQGLCQLLDIPVVGCDMTASAICMDKVATKEILSANAIPNVPYKIHRTGEAEQTYQTLTEVLRGPLFVKPARAGSSVGVSKVSTDEQLTGALRMAHEHDDVVLIEQAIAGRELEVAVLGNPPHHETSSVGEILTEDEFYSYEAKYTSDSTSKVVIPAELDNGTIERIRALAHQTYAALGCAGMARVDFFLTETGEVYVNEVNTIPGFTNISMYPKLWQHEGISYSELITRLITLVVNDTMLVG